MFVFVILALAALVCAAALVYVGRQDLARLARIEGTPTTHARDVSTGFVEVKGVVEAADLMTSPFYGVPAVYVRWQVEEYRSHRRSSQWVTVLEGVECKDFWIRDDSGRVRVPAAHLSPVLYLAGKNTTSSGTFRAAPEHIEQFLSKHGRSSTGWVFNKSMRYTEECIQPGEHIYALGWARREANEPAFTQAPQSSERGELILANLTEEELARRIGSRGIWMVRGGSILGLGAFTGLVFLALAR